MLDFFYQSSGYGDVVKKRTFSTPTPIKRRVPAANQASRWIIAYLKKPELRPSKPLLVDSPYKAKIGWHTVDGVFDLVQEVEIDGPKGSRLSTSPLLRPGRKGSISGTHLGLSIASYAFSTLFERREDRLTLAWLKAASCSAPTAPPLTTSVYVPGSGKRNGTPEKSQSRLWWPLHELSLSRRLPSVDRQRG